MIAVCAPTFGRPPDFVHPTPIYDVAKEIGGITPFTGGTSPHDRSRGLIQARAMQTEADAFLWIDDDIKATREQCLALVQAFRELPRGAQTLTGVYVCRHLASQGKVAFNFNLTPPDEGELDVRFGEAGDIYPITSHGFGFCIVKRQCFDTSTAPACEYEGLDAQAWWLPEVVERQHLGEDRSFTYRVWNRHKRLQLDDPMYVDTRLCVEHGGYRIL